MFWRQCGHWLTAAVIVVTGWGLTYGLVEQQRQANATLAQVRFTQEVRSSTDALSQRIAAYTEFTAGLRDLFLVNPYLRFDQFQQVTSIHNRRGKLPGNTLFVLCPPGAPAGAARLCQAHAGAGLAHWHGLASHAQRSA